MKNPVLRDYLKRPAVLIAASLALGVLTNLGFVKEVVEGGKKLTIDEVAEEASSRLPSIHIDEAAEAFMNGDALFVDARDSDSYESGHIPGAINVPWEEVQYDPTSIRDIVPVGLPVITYCDGTDCKASILLAAAMADLGYDDIRVFFGGWVEWEEAGFPVEEGEPGP